MMEFILALLGSSAVGTLLGGALALFNRRADMKAKELDFAQDRARWVHDLALRGKDIELAQLEARARLDVAIVEGDAQVESARMGAIAATEAADSTSAEELRAAGRWRWALVLASAYRKSMRSILTTLVGGAAVWVNLSLAREFQAGSAALDPELLHQALSWVSAQASMMFAYWFVARGNAAGPAR